MSVSSEKCWEPPGSPRALSIPLFVPQTTDRHFLLSSGAGHRPCHRGAAFPPPGPPRDIAAGFRTTDRGVGGARPLPPHSPGHVDPVTRLSFFVFETSPPPWPCVLCGKGMSVFASQLKMCDSQGPWLRPPAGLIANGSAEKARALSPPFFACLLLGASGFK